MLSVNRKVRSAGRTSGSVEITLPPEMHALEGVECRLILRDGSKPELVIQPDISVAQIVFTDLWEKLRLALQPVGNIGDFTLTDFNVAFLPPRHWRDRPPLSYRDALSIYRAGEAKFQYDLAGLSYLLTFLSVGAAYRLGLVDAYALIFGIVVGYWVTGICVEQESEVALDDIVHLLRTDPRWSFVVPGEIYAKDKWVEAQSGFEIIFAEIYKRQLTNMQKSRK